MTQPSLFDGPFEISEGKTVDLMHGTSTVKMPWKSRPKHPLGLDLKEGIRLKNEGHERAVTPRQEAVRDARDVAVGVAREKGDVTFDDVYEKMIRLGLNPKALGPAAGALFRTHEFVFTGEWRKSPRTTNHARMNRVWRLA